MLSSLLPQFEHIEGDPEQKYPGSIVQLEAQPSFGVEF